MGGWVAVSMYMDGELFNPQGFCAMGQEHKQCLDTLILSMAEICRELLPYEGSLAGATFVWGRGGSSLGCWRGWFSV